MTDDPVSLYARRVLAGDIVAGQPVAWACQRHLDDLERDDLVLDLEELARVWTFFGLLRHFEGLWESPTLMLEPWQQFVLGNVFGWKRKSTGLRRYRYVWQEVARKNGKSFVLSGVGLFGLLMDRENGPQIWTAATKRDQARIIHRGAIHLAQQTPEINSRVKIHRDRIFVPGTAGFFAPLGRDSKREDGLNPHYALVDEVHAHPDSTMWDVLASGMGARRQPILWGVTTAGLYQGFGHEQHLYYHSVVDPASGVEDDGAFVFLCQLGAEDDRYDEEVWEKANPNLRVSVSMDYLRGEAVQAKQNPRKENGFLCKNLNVWTSQAVRWISLDDWDEGAKPGIDEATLAGARAFGGLDLASTIDLTAFALWFPDTGSVVMRFWVPEDRIAARSREDRVPYDLWAQEGWISTTPGNAVDYAFIRAEILALHGKYRIQEIGFDPHNAVQLAIELQEEGVPMVRVSQGYGGMSGPSKAFERLVLAKQIHHGGHPVLRWCVGNVAVRMSPDEDIRPDKEHSTERIDGAVALIMAIGRAAANPVEKESVYAKRGVVFA